MSTNNWTANKIRKQFLDFFKDKNHEIVASAPLVLKDDPSLLFTNAGMNQFKDFFLDYKAPSSNRIADSQKCLRVSGKHNDLEDVGLDTYHHTLFEMLGNWSFGDYFKKEAINWAWELLTEVFKIPKDQIYVTIFEGDESENLSRDEEAYMHWEKLIATDRIIDGNKKDNFWEMGETGPCGPASEIHVDIRPKNEREKIDGKTLVNQDHPQVVEIWNLVFMQYNRKADNSLEKLKKNHIDTGMGFERLCMVLQNKTSNYDTDVFSALITKIAELSNHKYSGSMTKQDIAVRVIADHVRAISFAIADGQLPSNTGAGYVIRRILRRAVRYGYSFLNLKSPFIYELIPVLANQMGEAYPELTAQADFTKRVILEEENSFLNTLESGLSKLATYTTDITGAQAFELYDTYGFPFDLTQLVANEKGLKVDENGFETAMKKQKERSRKDAKVETGDWTILKEGNSKFIGYDELTAKTEILRYRSVNQKGKTITQLVLGTTPFYAESGGQVGDKGILISKNGKVNIFDTKKENDLIIHFTYDNIEVLLNGEIEAKVNTAIRASTENNHTATHLLHAALRQVLGTHVEQKGSLVAPDKLRFDFSHFGKMTAEELGEVEDIVNEKIGQAIKRGENRSSSFDEAIEQGAMALFGEKYGDTVRVITFDPKFSVELCGGCHVDNTAKIRIFKIISESAIAAGVRRIEAVTANEAIGFYKNQESIVKALATIIKNDTSPIKSVEQLIADNKNLQAKVDGFVVAQSKSVKENLKTKIEKIGDINFIGSLVPLGDSTALKNIAFELKNEIDNLVLILGATVNEKANLSIMIAENLVKEKDLDASKLIRELAKEIQGGGGGQAFYATAGGKNIGGLDAAIQKGKIIVTNI